MPAENQPIRLPLEPPDEDEVYRNIENYLGDLQHPLLHQPPRHDEVIPLEDAIPAIRFLGCMKFGDREPRELGYEDRLSYFRHLGSLNPDIFRLLRGTPPLTICLTSRDLDLDLGYLRGYSTVIPMTPEAYKDYTGGTFDPGRIGSDYIESQERTRAGLAEYIYIEGLFNVLSFRKDYMREGMISLFDMLYNHIRIFMPEVEFDVAKDMLIGKQGDRLPTILTCTNGRLGKELITGQNVTKDRVRLMPESIDKEWRYRQGIWTRGFWELDAPDPAGHAIYELNLNDYNLTLGGRDIPGECITKERRHQIARLLEHYLDRSRRRAQ